MNSLSSFLIILLLAGSSLLFGKPTTKTKNQTYTYEELIKGYQKLDQQNQWAHLTEIGKADVGKPIHLFILSKNKVFTAEEAKATGKTIVLINNGIHAGEVCGIDASLELSTQLLSKKNKLDKLLDSTIILIVPAYNIGGMLRRGSYSRANQNGPEEYGFRGNAQNLDLNRDFIKCDSENAMVFNRLFSKWDPDIFIDTHTTNGSDHQYTLTLIASQKDKLNPVLSDYMSQQILPLWYAKMKKNKMEMTPYIYSMQDTPQEGIKDFLETPRYSSGYAALFDCFSFITEAHVFKPFEARVAHTKAFLNMAIDYAAQHRKEIKAIRKSAKQHSQQQKEFAIHWELDSSHYDSLYFKGYSSVKRKSNVTGQEMRFYDTTQMLNGYIAYYNRYKAAKTVSKPKYYLIPQAYKEVIQRLEWNDIKLRRLKKDSSIEVTTNYISNYETGKQAYEAHYLHYNIKTDAQKEKIKFYRGDALVSTDQEAVRYIISCLEAESVDGFFAWNFFDGILQQKEWFSDYAFESKAKELLAQDPSLKVEFEKKKAEDPSFAKNNFAQLYFIYKRSPYYEKTVNRYPIYRIE